MSKRNDGGPANLPLVNGGHAVVSAIDLPVLSQSRWRLGANGYVYRVGGRAKGQPCLLHRIIMDAKAGQEIHHRDEDKLNCRRTNLAAVTPSEHQRYHRHVVIARNKASRRYPISGTCKSCGSTFIANPDHRGRQVCCSKRCGIELAVRGRKEKRYASA